MQKNAEQCRKRRFKFGTCPDNGQGNEYLTSTSPEARQVKIQQGKNPNYGPFP